MLRLLVQTLGDRSLAKGRRNDMNRTHKIKLEKEYCDSVYFGDKTFEVRYNDRGYQKGDYIRFIPVAGIDKISHPISDKEYEITYVHSGFGLEEMFVILGIKEKKDEGE